MNFMLLAQIIKRKMAFFEHACRNNRCSQNDAGERKKGAQYINNIKKWTTDSLEENKRVAEDRTAWREISCAAGAANVRTDAAD